MTVRLQRKIRRILATLDLADRPITAAELTAVTCHGPATIYPALHRLLSAGWIELVGGPRGVAAYELTEHGRASASLTREKQPAPLIPTEEARLAQDGIDTPGCDCGHTGMGVSWHGDDCPWRRSVVDCPGRPPLGPAAHNDGPSVEECREADRTWPLQKTGE